MTDPEKPARVALVTGAGGGIGRAVVATLAARGHAVVASDVDAPDAPAAAANVALDVTDTAGVERVVDDVETTHGPIDVLVCTAGIIRPARLLDTTDDDWAAVLDVNTTGVLRMLRAVGRRMAGRRHGSIVVVASNAGSVPRTGIVGYATSKAAAIHLTRCAGLELAEFGVRANVVSPGSTDTTMLRALPVAGAVDDAAEKAIAGSLPDHRVGIPLRRVADPADIAEAVAYLASDAARHVTMQELYVDGGASLQT
ncbi:SDR family oxidoreductase [Pseudonocardia dioxanivorans]|uniref:SDR family oxidoreductase n=1 Tax=Pseudonocardia dioxanivorans TaxID=240495 RepID=UPI000CD2A76F|nr:SDR family oxidoreductase [Pseudonocardia dioxanivorans]